MRTTCCTVKLWFMLRTEIFIKKSSKYAKQCIWYNFVNILTYLLSIITISINDRSVTFDHNAGSHQTTSKSQCCIDLMTILDQSQDQIIEIVTNCNCI